MMKKKIVSLISCLMFSSLGWAASASIQDVSVRNIVSGVKFTITWTGGQVPVYVSNTNTGVQVNSMPAAVSGVDYLEFFPYTNLTGTNTGTWVNVKGYKSCTCVVTIDPTTTGATLYLSVSSTNTGSTLPSANFHGVTSGSAIIATSINTPTAIASWLKLRVEENASSTVSASCIARKN